MTTARPVRDEHTPTACAACATPLSAEDVRCPTCGSSRGRPLMSWVTASAWITAVSWEGGARVVKRLKNVDDDVNRQRMATEARVVAALEHRLPRGAVPSVVASAPGVIVTRFVDGTTVQDILRRPRPDRSRAIAVAGRTVAALQRVDWSDLSLVPSAGGLIPDVSRVEDLFPAWALEAAIRAGAEESLQPVLVHGDCVPSNWLWNGRQVCLIDFGQLRVGSAQADPALAWARLRLLGGGVRPLAARRYARVIEAAPWPAAGLEWRANALVIVAWYDVLRFEDARPRIRDVRRAALRAGVQSAVRDLVGDRRAASTVESAGA